MAQESGVSPTATTPTKSERSIEPGITVQGTGSIQGKTDSVVVTVFVPGERVRVASDKSEVGDKETDKRVKAITAALAKNGVPDSKIMIQLFTQNPIDDLTRTRGQQNPEITVGKAASLTFVIHDLKHYNKTMEAAIAAGADAKIQLATMVSETLLETLKANALATAVKNAQKKAEAITKVLDSGTMELVGIREDSTFAPAMNFMGIPYGGVGAVVFYEQNSLAPQSTQTVYASVSVRYALKPAAQ
jgi:uncharacterized protein YggE